MSPRIVVFNNMITPYTNRLYNELVRRGLDLAILSCTEQEADRAWASLIKPAYEHRTVPGISFGKPGSRFTHVNFGVGRALKALAPDVVIVNGFFPSMLMAASWALAENKVLALTIDGWRVTMPNTPYHRIARPWLLRRCRAVICCSEKGKDYFRQLGVGDDRLFLVPLIPAWDGPDSVPDYRNRPFDLIWCARINDDCKNAVFFEDVAIALKRQIPDLAVRIVGTGVAEERMLRRLAEAGIRVAHDRNIAWMDISSAYLQSRLLMLPSLFESWGMVCNEAMQCGAPCIVSPHVGAGGELVQNDVNGFVCDLDAGTWVDRAARLLRDPERWSVMSERARQSARLITLDRVADAFMRGVDALAGASERGASLEQRRA